MNALFKFVLRGSAIGALSLLAVGAGCSSDDSSDNPGAGGDDSGGTSSAGKSTGGSKSDAGEPGSGGDKPNGGTTSVGGTGGGGTTSVGGDNAGGDNAAGASPTGAGGEGGDSAFGGGGETSTGTGPSVARFCNTLSFGSADTTMILEVGEGTEKVTFTATTGECSPPDGQECKEIPQGAAVPLVMFDADDTSTPLDETTANVDAGEDWVFWTDLGGTEADPFPIVNGVALNKSKLTCDEVTYADIP